MLLVLELAIDRHPTRGLHVEPNPKCMPSVPPGTQRLFCARRCCHSTEIPPWLGEYGILLWPTFGRMPLNEARTIALRIRQTSYFLGTPLFERIALERDPDCCLPEPADWDARGPFSSKSSLLVTSSSSSEGCRLFRSILRKLS